MNNYKYNPLDEKAAQLVKTVAHEIMEEEKAPADSYFVSHIIEFAEADYSRSYGAADFKARVRARVRYMKGLPRD